MAGASDSIFAIGDCTATSYAPTAQVASQQGAYLARVLTQLAKRDDAAARLKELEAADAAEAKGERAALAKATGKLIASYPQPMHNTWYIPYRGPAQQAVPLGPPPPPAPAPGKEKDKENKEKEKEPTQKEKEKEKEPPRTPARKRAAPGPVTPRTAPAPS